MKCKKLISLMLGCLLFFETPSILQAAPFPPDSAPSQPQIQQEEERLETASPTLKGQNGQDSQLAPDSAPSQDANPQETDKQADNPPSGTTLSQEETAPEGPQINLNYETCSLKAGESIQLEAFLTKFDSAPLSDAVALEISWVSDQKDTASVSQEGLVTAHKAGTATISAKAQVTTETGTYTASAACTVTVENTISLSAEKLMLYTCQTQNLTAHMAPEGAVTWISSDPSVASVNENGKILPKKAGKTTISATANGVSASCLVTVKTPSLTLKSKATVCLSSPVTLKASATPAGKITWKTSAPEIAAVSAKGKITPRKTGTVTITAICNGLKKTCTVTVKKPYVKLDTPQTAVFEGETCTLNAKARPFRKLTYRSSDPQIASVDKDGKIQGVKEGTAVITLSVPGAEASCEVTVLKNSYQLSRTSQILMKGRSTTLYLQNTSGSDSISFELSDPTLADISYSGNSCTLKARKAGRATLTAYCNVYHNNQTVTCRRTCTIRIIDSGIIQQQASIAVGAAQKLTLKNIDKPGTKATETSWSTSDPKIAAINPKDGTVTGKKAGTVKVTAAIAYSDGTSGEYTASVKVSDPQTKYTKTVISLGHSRKVALKGLNSYSKVTWKIKNPSLASVSPEGVVTAGYTAGKTTITIHVDGKTIKHTIHVTNPRLSSGYVNLAPGNTFKVPLVGVSAQSKISYQSKNDSVATVSDTGMITANNHGNAKIIVKADGNRFTFQVSVVPQRVIDACNTGYSIMYSSTYSQARRMSQGYYDCSSLVFRAYGNDTGLLGGIPSWAPTAASMASYMERTGKVIAYKGINVANLLPGDLIFYSYSPNGRYKNIGHVSMYYGGGYRLEKPLRTYYPEGNIAMIARPIR